MDQILPVRRIPFQITDFGKKFPKWWGTPYHQGRWICLSRQGSLPFFQVTIAPKRLPPVYATRGRINNLVMMKCG